MLVCLAAAIATAPACDEPRADDAAWRAEWDAVTGLVPPQDELERGGRELCEATLGALRTARPLLDPPPDPALDATVTGWFDVAELTFFECPPDGEPVEGFAAAYDELGRIEAEVDAVVPPAEGGRR